MLNCRAWSVQTLSSSILLAIGNMPTYNATFTGNR